MVSQYDLDAIRGELEAGEREPEEVDLARVIGGLDDPDERDDAVWVLETLGSGAVETLLPVSERLVDALSNEDDTVRERVAFVLRAVAQSDPDALVDELPALVAALEDDDALVTYHLSAVLASLVREAPEQFAAHVDAIRPLFEHRNGEVHGYATFVLTEIASVDPEATLPAVGTLFDAIDRDMDIEVPDMRPDEETVEEMSADLDPNIRTEQAEIDRRERNVRITTVGLQTIGEMAAKHPSVVRERAGDRADVLLDLLDHWDAKIRATAAGVLGYLGEVDPELLAEGEDRLIELLDDDRDIVRGNAMYALAGLDSKQAREALAEFARTEEVDELRATAASIVADF